MYPGALQFVALPGIEAGSQAQALEQVTDGGMAYIGQLDEQLEDFQAEPEVASEDPPTEPGVLHGTDPYIEGVIYLAQEFDPTFLP